MSTILRREIGNYSLICGFPNKYLDLKGTHMHHWYEREERIYQGHLEHFQKLTTRYFKANGPGTIKEIFEMENEYKNEVSSEH